MPWEPQPSIRMDIESGAIAALGAELQLRLRSIATGTIQITGTWVGTIVTEVSNDEFVTAYPAFYASTTVGLTNITTINGNFRFFGLSGYRYLRARFSSYTSGSALVTLSSSLGNSTQAGVTSGFFQDGETPVFLKPLLVGGTDPASGIAHSAKVNSLGQFLTLAEIQPGATVIEDNLTGRTAIGKTGSLTTTATTADQVVLTYTVTPGKTLFLHYLSWDVRLTVLSGTASILGTMSLEVPSGTKVITNTNVNPTTSHTSEAIYTFGGGLPIPSGTVIRVVCTPAVAASKLWIANFGGYEK